MIIRVGKNLVGKSTLHSLQLTPNNEWRFSMALSSHLLELNEKHRKLETTLHEELQHPSADPMKITELKKRKLRIKEEIERLQRQSV